MTPQEAERIRMQQRIGGWKSPEVKLIGVPNVTNPNWYPRDNEEGDDIEYD